jgi:hypothetical protein
MIAALPWAADGLRARATTSGAERLLSFALDFVRNGHAKLAMPAAIPIAQGQERSGQGLQGLGRNSSASMLVQ